MLKQRLSWLLALLTCVATLGLLVGVSAGAANASTKVDAEDDGTTVLNLHNSTANTVMVYSTLDGVPTSSYEYLQAILRPGETVNLNGRNEPNDRFDVYTRIFATTDVGGQIKRGQMVSWVAAKFDIAGAQISAGSDQQERLDSAIDERATTDNWTVPNSSFRAKLQRDEDSGQWGEIVNLNVSLEQLSAQTTPDNFRNPKGAMQRIVNSTQQPIQLWQRSSCSDDSQKGEIFVLAPGQSKALNDYLKWDQNDLYTTVQYADGQRFHFSVNKDAYMTITDSAHKYFDGSTYGEVPTTRTSGRYNFTTNRLSSAGLNTQAFVQTVIG